MGLTKRLRALVVFYLFLGQSVHSKPAGKSKKFESAMEEIAEANKHAEIEGLHDIDIIPGSNPDDEDRNQKRNALRNRHYLWVTKKVPYVIDSGLSSHEAVILEGMEEFHTKTCVTFAPKTATDDYWINIQSGTGCASNIGRQYTTSGAQNVYLGAGCYSKGTVVHELKHVLGFDHEQSRPDRDDYVEVFWDNIQPGKEYNFNKYSDYYLDDLNKEYDFDSIMHYGRYYFSSNGDATIIKINEPDRVLGQSVGLSTIDAEEVNALYDCGNAAPLSTWSEFSPCKYRYGICEKFRQRYCSSGNSAECPGANSYGIVEETATCTTSLCEVAVNGNWGNWGAWGDCSVTCGSGTKSRTRECNNPSPVYGGLDCVGSGTETGDCTIGACGYGTVDCDFESDLCQWVEDNSDIPCERNSGTTPSSGTGPNSDHTTGEGYYAFMESSSPYSEGQTTRIVSPLLEDTLRCFTLYYNMNGGVNMGSTTVYLKMESTGVESTLWEQTGNQGPEWKKMNLLLYSKGGDYRLVVKTVRGGAWDTDIAIDDISEKAGFC